MSECAQYHNSRVTVIDRISTTMLWWQIKFIKDGWTDTSAVVSSRVEKYSENLILGENLWNSLEISGKQISCQQILCFRLQPAGKICQWAITTKQATNRKCIYLRNYDKIASVFQRQIRFSTTASSKNFAVNWFYDMYYRKSSGNGNVRAKSGSSFISGTTTQDRNSNGIWMGFRITESYWRKCVQAISPTTDNRQWPPKPEILESLENWRCNR